MAETEIDWPWQYIREIKPGPVGCGSSLTSWCAALAAALADWAGQAALTEAYPERDDSLLQDISAVASVYQQELLALAEQDVKAVQQLNEASKLPAGTAEEWEELLKESFQALPLGESDFAKVVTSNCSFQL